MNANSIAEHLMLCIGSADLYKNPFLHVQLRGCFPSDVYRQMMTHLPAPTEYRPLYHQDARQSDGSSARGLLELTQENVSGLPDEQRRVWENVAVAATSPEVKNALFRKLCEPLSQRFGINSQDVTDIPATPRPALCRDVTGYRIKPHCDTPTKIMTMQFYFPADDSQSHLGTTLYENVDREFEPVKTLPFESNSAYAFIPNDRSWHGREPIQSDDGIRNSLLLIFFEGANGY